MRMLLAGLVALSACGPGDSCTGDVQWALFDVADFVPFCEGDFVEIRAFSEQEYLVDVNLQFRGIDGDGAVSGSWALAFDGVFSHSETRAEIPSYDTETGWWRVHVLHWLSQTEAAEVAALEASIAMLSATSTDVSGNSVASTVDLVAVAP